MGGYTDCNIFIGFCKGLKRAKANLKKLVLLHFKGTISFTMIRKDFNTNFFNRFKAGARDHDLGPNISR